MIILQDLSACFVLIYERLAENEEHLNQLDSGTGDGDHGTTMVRAFRAAAEAVQPAHQDVGAVFDTCAEAQAEYAGGAIGPLLASLFAEGGLVFDGQQAVTLQGFRNFLTRGLTAIQEIGGAQAGDKTLIDALIPAAEAMRVGNFDHLADGLEAAAQGASEGAAATREMTAAQGRARFAADRSVGSPDAGAISITLVLQAFSDFAAGIRPAITLKEVSSSFTPPPGRFINHPDTMVAEDNQGLALAYPDLVKLHTEGVLLRANPKASGKVALAIGHGGGHTPSMGGFVGPGLLDADVYGPLFTCASGVRISRAIELAEKGAGVALLVSNHSGDVLNARLAVRRAGQKGIKVEPILLGDDIATAPRTALENRRGLGGLLFALKIGGAAAEEVQSLADVARLMRKTNQRTASLMVSGRAPFHPVSGKTLFELREGQIEIGAGVHGEVGVYRGEHLPADEIIDLLMDQLLDDLSVFNPEKVLAFVNGAGGTSKMELHILYRRVSEVLTARGIHLAAGVIGSYFTTLEMGGFSLSLCVPDEEMLGLWEQPASGPSFHWPYA
jgi:dihydroxyacetone kinase-like protein